MLSSGISFFIDFLNYYLVYKWIFGASFRKQVAVNIGIVAGFSLLAMGMCASNILLFEGMSVTFCAILALLCIVKDNRVRVLLLFPITFFLSGAINILGSYLVYGVSGIPYNDMMNSELCKIGLEVTCPGILCLLKLFVKGFGNRKDILIFNAAQYLIGLLGSVCLFFVIGISQGVMQGKTEIAKWIQPLAFCVVIVGILFVILIIWQFMIEKRVLEYKMENEFYQNYLKKQEMHIHDIIEADQKIRRFRHDINAHITALEQGIKVGDVDQLEKYVQRLKEESQKFTVKRYTGLSMVDAVVSEWYQRALEEKIEWEWEGEISQAAQIEIYDLCVIFSNLLSNAVEAARQVEEGREKKIGVHCGTFRDRICIRITNTCKENVDPQKLSTTKRDVNNHGFGLRNVQSIVDDMHGEFQKKIDQGLFCAEIVL